ncbi:serine hydrolase domain-containing protein [Mesoflavibacter sp. CH_XMU1404-2]|uniref:serine hydrolase domain-containing protein n=1 Tax=Mesoflavibacter sp. CH_XMU1404-2 TaxID=3107766 RepID=UPI00300BB43B
MRFQEIITIIIFFISSGCQVQGQNIEQEEYHKVDSVLKSYYKPLELGAALSVIKNGEIVYSNQIGLANLEHQIPITNTTLFNIASVSKQFTAYLALLLEDEGKLSFNDDIRIHLPELKHLPYKITIKQLTNHTHGLPNPDELAQLKGVKTMHHYKVLDMLLSVREINFKPGTMFEYNNTGYILLAEIIKRVGKKSFEEQLQEKIFKPLGMTQTHLVEYTDDVIKNKAYSYKSINGVYINFPVQLATIGSSGIYTSINDLSLWAKNYQKTKVGKREYFDKMQQITTTSTQINTNYGIGLQVDKHKGIDVVFHGGGTESYRSYILHAPKHDISIIFLSNKASMLGLDIVYKSLEIILKRGLLESKLKNPISNSTLKKYEGTYEIYPGLYYNITTEGEKLYWQQIGYDGKVELPMIDENTFKFPPYPHSKFIFHINRIEFQIADIVRYCKRIHLIKEVDNKLSDLEKYTGFYKNEELNIIYEIKVLANKLVAILNTTYKITLNPLSENSFYSSEAFFGKVNFIYDTNNLIQGFKVSGQNINEILFEKLNK